MIVPVVKNAVSSCTDVERKFGTRVLKEHGYDLAVGASPYLTDFDGWEHGVDLRCVLEVSSYLMMLCSAISNSVMVAIASNVVWAPPCMVVSGDSTTHVASVAQQTAIVLKAGTKNERMVVGAM